MENEQHFYTSYEVIKHLILDGYEVEYTMVWYKQETWIKTNLPIKWNGTYKEYVSQGTMLYRKSNDSRETL